MSSFAFQVAQLGKTVPNCQRERCPPQWVHFVLVSLAADTTLAANGRFGGEPVVSEAAAKDLPRDVEKGSPQFVAAESMATNLLFGFDSYSNVWIVL